MAALLVVDDLNTDLEAPEGRARDKVIAAAISTVGIKDMSRNFLPWRNPWFTEYRTWIMLHGGQEVRSWTNYILGTDRRIIRNMGVWDARYNTDHHLVLGCLRGATHVAHSQYLGTRTLFPIRKAEDPGRGQPSFLWALEGHS